MSILFMRLNNFFPEDSEPGRDGQSCGFPGADNVLGGASCQFASEEVFLPGIDERTVNILFKYVCSVCGPC